MLLLNEKETRIVRACQAGFRLYIAARFDYDEISPPTFSFCSTGSGAWHRSSQVKVARVSPRMLGNAKKENKAC